MGYGNLATAICSQSNPFCPEANGAKLMDENSARSVTWQHRSSATISSDAAGLAMVAVSGGALDMIRLATLAAGVTSAWGASVNSSLYTTIGTTSGDQQRIVSWGFRFKTTLPYTTASGLMIVTETSADIVNVTSAVGQDPGNMRLGNVAESYAVRDGDIYFIGRPLGAPSNEYQNINNPGSGHFTTALLALTGCAASSVIGYLETVINYEWTPRIGTSMAVMATPAAPANPAVLTARARLFDGAQTIGKVTTKHDHDWMGMAVNAARTLGPMAIGAVFGPAAGAGAYAATHMIKDVD